MAARRTKAKDDLSARLAADVAEFLANGGKIDTVDYRENQSFKLAHKGKQHIPMTVAPKKLGMAWRVSGDGKGPQRAGG